MELPPFPLAIERRVGFSQTDASGLIHFTTYFTFMEAAEVELFRLLGSALIWEENGITYGFPRVDTQCRYRRPVGFDDLIRIELSIDEIVDNRIHYAFMFTDSKRKRVAMGTMVTAFASRDHTGVLTSATIPENLKTALETWKNQKG